MDTCPNSNVESGGSSPCSLETDFDTKTNTHPPQSSWEDQPQPQVPPNHKVKFMVSYGGKIQPRQHDNHLSYVGGHTKILYVERSISFSALISKLFSLIYDDTVSNSLFSFKYQLPGEDLDALISVSNDDDLEHLMLEYDRLYRASPKPVRFRLFLFPGQSSRLGSGSSDHDPDRFVEALNSGPAAASSGATSKVDCLLGLDNKGPVQPDNLILSDQQIEARIQELNRLQISVAGQPHQKPTPATTIPASVHSPASYWQPSPAVKLESQQQQPVYVVHAPPPASIYHAPQPLVRPTTHGYYQVQQAPPNPVYREQPVYTMATGGTSLSIPPPPAPVTLPTPVKFPGYSDGFGLPARPVAGLPETAGRPLLYGTPGGVGMVTTSFQGVAAVVGVDGKIFTKISQT